MSPANLESVNPPPDGVELVPRYFDTELIVTPDDNPVYTPAMLADLLASIREHGQLVPGWVCPSPELPEPKRLCYEGNRRLAVARMLGVQFWAFDLGRFVPEPERIKLLFHHHQSRRVMSREEITQRAARYIELTSCTDAEAAKHLNISGPALSRAFGEQRILPELKARAAGLGPTIRSLIAATPPECMAQALEFAESPGPGGRPPTRDLVATFIKQLKNGTKPKGRKPRSVALRLNGRAVTLSVSDQDTASSVADDLKTLANRLGKHADVAPEGWPFLFQ